MIVHNPNGTLPVDTIDFPAEHWPELKAYIAKTYGKSREEKIREAVEQYRKDTTGSTGFRNGHISTKERARRIVEFAVEQLNDGWKPDWKNVTSEKHEVYYEYGKGRYYAVAYSECRSIGAIHLKSPADLPLLLSLCGDEMEVLRG